MANKLTVIENGKATEIEISDEMAAGLKALGEWDGWCRCDKPETGHIEHRGHSVDVFCRNCGDCLQVG